MTPRKPKPKPGPAGSPLVCPGLPEPTARWVPRLVLWASILCSLGLHLSRLPEWLAGTNPAVLGSLPLMHTADAYHYLRLAKGVISGQTSATATGLLPATAATLQAVLPVPLEWIAFFLPVALASLMSIAYLNWGRLAGGLYVALIAGLAGSAGTVWMERTGLGDFDTDGLILVLSFAIAWSTYCFAAARGSSLSRHVHLASALVLTYLLYRWWDSNGFFAPLLLIACYSLTIALPSSRLERLAKIGVMLGGVLLLAAAILGFHDRLPPPLSRPVAVVAGNLQTLIRQTDSEFGAVSSSIDENLAYGLENSMRSVAGHPAVFIAGGMGLLLLLIRRWRECGVLLPLLALGLGGFHSNRLLVFYVPFQALGLGYLLGHALWRNRFAARIPRTFRPVLLTLLTSAALAPGFQAIVQSPVKLDIESRDARLAQAIGRVTPPDAMVWGWWDYGYVTQYLSGRRTFIDNGSQSDDRVYISAFPLCVREPRLAANWMRFFAARDLAGLDSVSAALGGRGPALEFLKQALADPDRLETFLPPQERPRIQDWRDFLYPRIQVVLSLNTSLLDKAVWFNYFGTWDYVAKRGALPVWERHDKDKNDIDPSSGRITIKSTRQYRLARVFVQARDGRLGKAWAENQTNDDNVVLIPDNSPYFYIMGGDIYRRLGISLLYDAPLTTPGFRPLYYNPLEGGAWLVE